MFSQNTCNKTANFQFFPYQSKGKCNSNKKTIFAEGSAMIMNILQSFSFIPLIASEELDFLIFFHKFNFSVAMEPAKLRGLD